MDDDPKRTSLKRQYGQMGNKHTYGNGNTARLSVHAHHLHISVSPSRRKKQSL